MEWEINEWAKYKHTHEVRGANFRLFPRVYFESLACKWILPVVAEIRK